MCIVCAILYASSLLNQLQKINHIHYDLQWFIVGMSISLLYNLLFSRSKGGIIFRHELTHLLWAKIFKGKMISLYISRSGGYAHHHGGLRFGQSLVTLAPYFFPLVPLVLLLLRAIVRLELTVYLSGLIGFTLLSFYYDVVLTLRTTQSDIKIYGVMYSLLMIIFFNVIFLGIILCAIAPGISVADFIAAKGILKKLLQ